MNLPIINAIWIGPELGPIHVACLRSFLRHGHSVVLHCYEAPIDLPAGVQTRDARELMPESSIMRYNGNGSPALFANLYRYELLRAGLGLYVDCDVFCLKPIVDTDYIFGWEKYRDSGRNINNAVLRLPSDCPALRELCEIKFWRKPPMWMSHYNRRALYKRHWTWLFRQPESRALLESMPWGSTGPDAVTHVLIEHQLAHHAQPIDVFYPISGNHVRTLLVDPELSLEELVTHRTLAVHIASGHFRDLKKDDIPPSSPLGTMISS